jgi:hypothetical protein
MNMHYAAFTGAPKEATQISSPLEYTSRVKLPEAP